MITQEILEGTNIEVNKFSSDEGLKYVFCYNLDTGYHFVHYTEKEVLYRYNIEEFDTEHEVRTRCIELGFSYEVY